NTAPFNGAIIEGRVGIGTDAPDDKLDVEGNIRINDSDLFLRPGNDGNHGLGWFGQSKQFSNVDVNGPVLYGNSGGALATRNAAGSAINLRWTGNGLVGVGTTTPKNKLDVEGGVAIGSTYSGTITAPSNGAIIEGNVGIGTDVPDNKLEVEGSIRINDNDLFLRNGTDVKHGLGWYGLNKLFNNVGVDGPVLYGNSGGALAALNAVDTTINLRWTGNGQVGIGTTSPKNRLDVEGEIAIGRTYSGTNTAPSNGAIIEGNVGIGTTSPKNRLDVEGGIAIGNTYSGTNTAPSNGAIIEGNVGIGTDVPDNKLDVEGSIRINDNDLFLRNGTDVNHGLGWYGVQRPFPGFMFDGPVLYGFSGGALGTTASTQKTALTWNSNGNVGIGTDNPTRAKLEVSGFSASFLGAYGFLNSGGGTNTNGGGTANYSIYASNRIAATEFNAFSDVRIKKVLGQSNSEEDLNTLMAIEITDYQHIDTFQNGTQAHKKVIAQQVAEVFPQAVTNTIREVIPDIYQRAEVNNNWIQLNTDLQVGDRVKLITAKSKDIHEVIAVEANRFQVAELEVEDQERVFVYGREVDDFHTVDYEAISMLNVSATQAQQTIIEVQQQEIEALKAEIQQLKDLESRFATLEALLNVPDAPASLNTSSTKK
ncbi:MAG: tail fiber domain-containing protein, partial [Bacteroidota bacterium]